MVIKKCLGEACVKESVIFNMSKKQGGEIDERGIFIWTYNCAFWH